MISRFSCAACRFSGASGCPQYYNADAIRWLRDDWNCNLVRAAMAVGPGGYLTNPDEEMRKVRVVIDTAIELGIYIIVDWHDHNADRNVEAASSITRRRPRGSNSWTAIN